jgi:ABC-type uncharacterized transport system fused permease/ATPase subunit
MQRINLWRVLLLYLFRSFFSNKHYISILSRKTGQIKLRLMPDFKKLTMLQSELEGDYRTAHSRLITNSEEISFFDGANRERAILTTMFDRLYAHVASFSEKKAWIGVIDQVCAQCAQRGSQSVATNYCKALQHNHSFFQTNNQETKFVSCIIDLFTHIFVPRNCLSAS